MVELVLNSGLIGIGIGLLFILALGGLSNQETARRGNIYGVLGMLLALGATLMHERVDTYALIGGCVVVGS